MKKIADVCKIIFGYVIMICLFAGGLTFFGYLAALIIGGSIAETVCFVIYKKIIPVIIYISTVTVLFGLVSMYFSGEMALVPNKRRNDK